MSTREMESIHIQTLDIPYIKKLGFYLSSIGSWPSDMIEKRSFANFRNTKLFLIVWVFGSLSAMSYLIKNFKVLSFLDQGRLYINVLLCFVSLQRFTVTWLDSYENIIKEFVYKVHLFHHKNKNNFARKTYTEVEKISSILCHIIHIELIVGVIFFNLAPIYNSYCSGMFNSVKPLNAAYDQGAFYDLPFDYTTNFTGWLVVFIFNGFFSYAIACIICTIDLLLLIVTFHLWGHIKILKYNLVQFPRPAMNVTTMFTTPWYNKEESDAVRHLLIESIQHYNLIKNYMDKVSNTFGVSIGFYLVFHQISGCILLVECSEMTAESFLSYGTLTLTLFQQLIQMSVTFELLGTQSETIKDAVYEVPWECMDTKNRTIVLIYLCIVQEPLQIKALGMVPVGVQTMASILKTSVSYFMLLRTSSHNND